ncbi:MAG: hypothetical protein HN846_04785 [Candidatus Pacebacteria bacterium]|jgi:hypothetical protein|nr:hypothetical protein [Candidatus Paceibacterota bacterium]MBT4004732.1 hypothetical protein [Candidatus Paceibacterota bacterium]MBT6899277.1 hypothetical protein [Candidatus Paceibacterota bacterium]MBT7184177.1 hypothetical protein [Candidatus Paceibacterota bacterium]MBT7309991.1 hypothetical protein [Candidatus Paceibacterota bacterium]
MLKELLEYLWKNKAWWITPPIIVFLIFGAMILFAETSPVGSFVYMLF